LFATVEFRPPYSHHALLSLRFQTSKPLSQDKGYSMSWVLNTACQPSRDRIFLNWVAHCTRSEVLAQAFNTKIFFIPYLQRKGIIFTSLRYLCALIATTGLLLWRRPKLVFAMNQPVFLPILVYLLSFINRCQFVVDSHSGLFNKKKWMWAQPLMKWVCRRSVFTIVTNTVHKEIVESWGADVEILGSLIVPDHGSKQISIDHPQTIVVIGTFAEDEPTLEVLRAASLCSKVQFYMTGDYRKASRAVLEMRPQNLSFTGFLKQEEYISLVKSVDGAMILVTNDNTMQRGAYEAMSWGIPIITSDWAILRDAFPKGVVFVQNDMAGIVDGVADFFQRKEQLKLEIQELRCETSYEFERRIREITKRYNLAAKKGDK
jgi:glycosyltransferase involved in cell wall biosynthesis